MEPRDLARISILLSFGALFVGLAAWMLAFAVGQGPGASSPLGWPVLVAGVVLLLAGLALVGGAGADAVWSRLQRLRARPKP